MDSNRKGQKLMVDVSVFEVRQRAALFARERWPTHTEKTLQRELDVSESTAGRILAGAASSRSLQRMMRRWGWAFVHFVYEPLCGSVAAEDVAADVAALEHGLDEMDRRAQAARAKLAALRDSLAGAA